MISKKFDFAMAHRVYNQKSDEFEPKCKRIHGHEYVVTVYLTSGKLDESDMVLDFNYLKKIKAFLDEYFDHRFVISIHDKELLEELNQLLKIAYVKVEDYDVKSLTGECIEKIVHSKRVVKLRSDSVILNSITLIDTNTTSECLAKLFFEEFQKLLEPYNVKVTKVDVHETPKSKATYMVKE